MPKAKGRIQPNPIYIIPMLLPDYRPNPSLAGGIPDNLSALKIR
jgi:hypothetical protein